MRVHGRRGVMNDLNAFLKELLTILQQTKNFAIENAPLIAQQKIQSEIFNVYVFWFSLLLSTLFVIFLACASYRIAAKIKDKELSELAFMSFLFSCLILLGLIVTILVQGPTSIENYYKLKNTPQLYLLEWVKSEIKK